MPTTDPTPIPAEAVEAAAKVAFRRYESEYSVAPNTTWQDFVPEVRELVEVVAPILLAAGRTAAADAAERRVIEAAKVWRVARLTEVSGGTYHRACRALDQAVAAALGELHAEPMPPPTEDDLARGRAIVAAAGSFNDRAAARVAEHGADR